MRPHFLGLLTPFFPGFKKGSTASLLQKWQDESGVVAEILVDLVASGEM